MRQILFAGMLTGLLACTGCFTGWNGQAELKAPAPPVAVSKAPPIVRPEQVTSANPHQVCEYLQAELDWESQQRMLTSR